MARDHGGVLRIFRLDKNGGLANALNVGLTVVCLMPMSLRKKTYRWILR